VILNNTHLNRNGEFIPRGLPREFFNPESVLDKYFYSGD